MVAHNAWTTGQETTARRGPCPPKQDRTENIIAFADAVVPAFAAPLLGDYKFRRIGLQDEYTLFDVVTSPLRATDEVIFRHLGATDVLGIKWAVRVPLRCESVDTALHWFTPFAVLWARWLGEDVYQFRDIFFLRAKCDKLVLLSDTDLWLDDRTRRLTYDGMYLAQLPFPVRVYRGRQLTPLADILRGHR